MAALREARARAAKNDNISKKGKSRKSFTIGFKKIEKPSPSQVECKEVMWSGRLPAFFRRS